MKNLILLIFVLLSLSVFSQRTVERITYIVDSLALDTSAVGIAFEDTTFILKIPEGVQKFNFLAGTTSAEDSVIISFKVSDFVDSPYWPVHYDTIALIGSEQKFIEVDLVTFPFIETKIESVSDTNSGSLDLMFRYIK